MKKIELKFTHNNQVARIFLNDGKGNIIDQAMTNDLLRTFDDFKTNEDIKLIVFEGNGKHFSFGASVEEHKKENALTMLKGFHQLFYNLQSLSIPTVSLISGQCLGGGMELAIMCNFIFADKTAKFGQPEIILGVFPPPASIILSEKIGLAKAEDLLITGKTITAEQAFSIGLVNEIVDDKIALNSFINSWIEAHIIEKSASSLRYAVKASRIKFNHILNTFLPQLEDLYINQLMETFDANEGIHSFLEKRKPVWKTHNN